MVRDSRHGAVYIFGAICPERGLGAASYAPELNSRENVWDYRRSAFSFCNSAISVTVFRVSFRRVSFFLASALDLFVPRRKYRLSPHDRGRA